MTRCIRELGCSAQTHEADCPWHPENVPSIVVDDAFIKRLLDDGEAITLPRLTQLLEPYHASPMTPREIDDVKRLVSLQHSEITFNNWAMTLQMRYPFERWQLIMAETVRRMNEKPS